MGVVGGCDWLLSLNTISLGFANTVVELCGTNGAEVLFSGIICFVCIFSRLGSNELVCLEEGSFRGLGNLRFL